MKHYFHIKQAFLKTTLFAGLLGTGASLLGAGNAEKIKTQFTAENDSLYLPMSAQAEYTPFEIFCDGKKIASYGHALLSFDRKAWEAEIDISAYRGKTLVLESTPKAGKNPKIRQGKKNAAYTKEAKRPLFHFSTLNGWLNDPNGLVYFNGQWHLFHQYNPYSHAFQLGLHWAHAVSDDLVNWRYLPQVFTPSIGEDGTKYEAWSGTAYFDAENKSGFFKDGRGGVLFTYTKCNSGETLVASDDLKTYREVGKNPFITAAGRDPRIFFNKDSGLWTVVRYEESGKDKTFKYFFAKYVSKDLKTWERCGILMDYAFECPDFRKMPVEGTDESKWLVFDAAGNYTIGDFDGRNFKNAMKYKRLRTFFGANYAMQTWNNAPDNRTLAVAVMRTGERFFRQHDQPYSRSMTLPWELYLVRGGEFNYSMRARIPRELAERFDAVEKTPVAAEKTQSGFSIKDIGSSSYILEGEAELNDDGVFKLDMGVGAYIINTHTGDLEITCKGENSRKYKPDPLFDRKKMKFSLIVDLCGAELMINDGQAVISLGAWIDEHHDIEISAKKLSNLSLRKFTKKDFLPKKGN